MDRDPFYAYYGLMVPVESHPSLGRQNSSQTKDEIDGKESLEKGTDYCASFYVTFKCNYVLC